MNTAEARSILGDQAWEEALAESAAIPVPPEVAAKVAATLRRSRARVEAEARDADSAA